jgi:hypothetical protein
MSKRGKKIYSPLEVLTMRTKNMTAVERTAYFNQRGEVVAKKYGFRTALVS